MGGLNGRPTGTGTTSLNTAIEASGNLGDNFRKPEIPGSNDRVHDGRDGGPDGDSGSMNKYWVSPADSSDVEDLVVIHVCDETRQISKDFCCKRDILVKHMKYFEKFLQENEWV